MLDYFRCGFKTNEGQKQYFFWAYYKHEALVSTSDENIKLHWLGYYD